MNFPRYELIERINKGFSSEVWKAYRKDLDLPVALKIYAPKDEWDDGEVADWQALFLNEASILPWLHHPSILRFYDLVYGAEGEVAIATEYVKGRSLDEIGKIDLTLAGMIAVRVLGALVYLQRPMQIGLKNYPYIVHGDIKPSNIMVTGDGIRLIDFGFSCPDPGIDSRVILGTPRYISPARRAGREPTWLDDVYSLAYSLLELAGIKPGEEIDQFDREDPVVKLFLKMLREDVLNLSSLIGAFSAQLGNHNYGPQIAALAVSPRGGFSTNSQSEKTP